MLDNTMVLNQHVNNVFDDGHAVLYLFSPRYMYDQQLRPYLYKFNNCNIVEMLMDRSVTMTDGINRNRMNEVVNKSIYPDAHGITMHTSYLHDKWTFVLVVDVRNDGSGPVRTTIGTKTRQVMVGYCIEEPINPTTMFMSTPTVNPRCILKITHCNVCHLSNTLNEYGSRDLLNVRVDEDTISQSMDQYANDNLYMIQPSNLMATTSFHSGNEEYTALSDSAVSNLTTKSGLVSSALKSPRHHLRELTTALDAAVLNNDNMSLISSMHTSPATRFNDEVDPNRFSQQVSDTLASNAAFSPYNIVMGLDPSRVMSLGDLSAMFPNMVIMPFKQDYNPGYEVRPQQDTNPQTVMSSLVSASTAAIATNCGIVNVMFRYNSWMGKTMTNEGGTWSIHSFTTILQLNEFDQMNCLRLFKATMENDLFPILKAMQGEFDLSMVYDASGNVIVDLQYLDRQTIGGLYEKSSMLGGTVNPMVGTADNFMHNYRQLKSLMNESMVKGGVQDFHPENCSDIHAGMMCGQHEVIINNNRPY